MANETNPDYMNFLVKALYDCQGERIRYGNRLQNLEDNGRISQTNKENLESITGKRMQVMESEVKKIVKKEVQKYRIWSEWLKDVKGIGEPLVAVLIKHILNKTRAEYKDLYGGYYWGPDPNKFNEANREELLKKQEGTPTGVVRTGIICFPTRSALHAYAGLHVINGKAAKRKQGQPANWNNFLKTKASLLADCIVKNGLSYRAVYDNFRRQEGEKGLKAGHAHNRAMRHTIKIFLSHFWTVARLQEGLAVEAPYPFKKPEVLPSKSKHIHYIPPLRDEGKFSKEWEETWSSWGEYPVWLDDNIKFLEEKKEASKKKKKATAA
jgi:hypothetical protein